MGRERRRRMPVVLVVASREARLALGSSRDIELGDVLRTLHTEWREQLLCTTSFVGSRFEQRCNIQHVKPIASRDTATQSVTTREGWKLHASDTLVRGGGAHFNARGERVQRCDVMGKARRALVEPFR